MKMFHSLRMTAWLFLVCVAGLCGELRAQATVDIKIDSLELLVGQQTQLTLDVSADAKAKVVFPEIKKGSELTPGVEVVDVARADTQLLNDGGRMLLSQ